jgi:beta-ribofuranosylaminobenzene 5'-phosphate synthase
MDRVVRVTAPSRLHFGLWSLGGTDGRQFGGVGATVERPQLRLTIEPAVAFETAGAHAQRTLEFARRWAEFHGLALPCCRIHMHEVMAEHAGLGSGTQLALSVAAGLNAFCGLPSQTPQELATSVGRGLRSAVGTYGFVFGGLIVEQGKLPGEPISPLHCRIDLPSHWRFVLILPRGLSGLAGQDEADAFHALPPVPPAVTERLIEEIRDRLVPAAATGHFEHFAESLYRYGRLSGECFAARQGGPYNGPLLTALVDRIRGLGHIGVGQSSWGPTIYVVQPTQEAADRFTAELSAIAGADDLQVTVSPPCNDGARIEVGRDAARELEQVR